MVGAGPGGPVPSGGAALHPSGSVRCTDSESTKADAAPLPTLPFSCPLHEVVADGWSAIGDDVTLSRSVFSLNFADVSMESDEELVHS